MRKRDEEEEGLTDETQSWTVDFPTLQDQRQSDMALWVGQTDEHILYSATLIDNRNVKTRPARQSQTIGQGL